MDEPRFCLRFLYHFGDDVGLEPKAQQATTKQIRQLTLAVRLSHISRNDENCKLRVILAYQRCAGDARGFESVKTVALHDGQTPVSGCTPTAPVCSRSVGAFPLVLHFWILSPKGFAGQLFCEWLPPTMFVLEVNRKDDAGSKSETRKSKVG